MPVVHMNAHVCAAHQLLGLLFLTRFLTPTSVQTRVRRPGEIEGNGVLATGHLRGMDWVYSKPSQKKSFESPVHPGLTGFATLD